MLLWLPSLADASERGRRCEGWLRKEKAAP
jgi:hypothetical protein